MGDEGALAGTLAVAEEQTAGRGLQRTSWESPAGAGIFMSVLLRPRSRRIKRLCMTIVNGVQYGERNKKIF